MARFTITLSSGDELDVEAPDAVTDEQLLSLAKKQLQEGERIIAIDEVDGDLPTETSPEEIKARGEEAYKQMMADIADERRKQTVKDRYGWMTSSTPAKVATSLLMPSSVESVLQGREPSLLKDGLIDAGLVASSLIPPLRGATTGATIAKNVGLQTALSSAGEAATAAAHDRSANLLAPVAGAVGGLLSGAAVSNQINKLRNTGIPEDQIPGVLNSLDITQAKTTENIRKSPEKSLRDILASEEYMVGAPSESTKLRYLLEAGEEYKTPSRVTVRAIDRSRATAKRAIDSKRIRGEISKDEADRLTKELDNLDDALIDIMSREQRVSDRTAGFLGEPKEQITDPRLVDYITEVERVQDPTTRRIYLNTVSGNNKKLSNISDRFRAGAMYDELKAPKTELDLMRPMSIPTKIAPYMPHNVETGRKLITPSVSTSATRIPSVLTSMGGVAPEKDKEKSAYTSQGDLIYAPRGRITYQDLWGDADEIRKNKKK